MRFPQGIGVRKRGPVALGFRARAQSVPTEPVQLWGTRRPPVLPMQVDKLHVAIDHVAADDLGEDVGGVSLTRPLGEDEIA